MQTRLSTTQQQHQQFRQQLRQHIRKTRRNLTALQQQQAAQRIAQQALSFIEQHQAQHIALYLAVDGEIATQPLIEQLWQQAVRRDFYTLGRV